MKKQTFFILGIIVLTLFLLLLFSLIFFKEKKVNSYYQNLMDKCKSSCCRASAKEMEASSFKLAVDNACPTNYKINTLRCIDSYVWCEPVNKKENENNFSGWKIYHNGFYKDYEIKYPPELTLTEKGQDNRAAVLTSKNYKLDMASGLLQGFKINIFVNDYETNNNLDNLFVCNNELNIYNCLLADSNLLLNYKNGSIKKEVLTINKHPAIKYEFTSNNGGNNSMGIVVKKDNNFYIVAATYQEENRKLFNQILSTFKFIDSGKEPTKGTVNKEECEGEGGKWEYFSLSDGIVWGCNWPESNK